VKKGKFLGCLVSTKGIEANPSKIEAILRMEPPSTKKGAQRLAGRLASLNRFISRSTERNLPFFEILKSAEVFQWGPAQQKSFEELKQYVGAKAKTLPFAPAFVYLAAPTGAEEPARSTLRLVHYKTKAYDDVAPSHVLTRPGGPRGIRPIVTGPARRSVLRARSVIAFL
jgi:hypothetical protein